MILDEPLTGLDAAAARQVKDILLERVRAGCTVVLTTHILEIAERLAERISIIARGRIVAQGTHGRAARAASGRGGTLEDVFLELTREGTGARGGLGPASWPWLAAHELRLLWRSQTRGHGDHPRRAGRVRARRAARGWRGS